MSNNEITREISFKVKAEYFKKNVTEYFSKYKNDSGAEDCIEICLIREGYRAVLGAEKEINRQKAEIEMDDVEIKELRIALQGYLDDLTKERNLYKKSIEELNQAKAENERLKTNLNIELENYATEYDNKIKAEAYREFAERVKLEFYYEFDELIPSIMSDRIDNLLKELVGEDDG